VFPQSFGSLCMVSMGHSKGEIKTLSNDGRSVNAGENMHLGFLTKRFLWTLSIYYYFYCQLQK
jgi:hypothetical protein